MAKQLSGLNSLSLSNKKRKNYRSKKSGVFSFVISLKYLLNQQCTKIQPSQKHFWEKFKITDWKLLFFFFYLGFLLRTFTNHRTAEEGGGHFFNSSLPLPTASQTLRHKRQSHKMVKHTQRIRRQFADELFFRRIAWVCLTIFWGCYLKA